jgi:hypothetical protein
VSGDTAAAARPPAALLGDQLGDITRRLLELAIQIGAGTGEAALQVVETVNPDPATERHQAMASPLV